MIWHFVEASGNEWNGGNLNIYDLLTISGPVLLSIGLLVTVCGLTWVPIYEDKIKHLMRDEEYG